MYLTQLFRNDQYVCSFGNCLTADVDQPNGNRFCMVNFDSFELALSTCYQFGCDTIAKYQHEGECFQKVRFRKQ